MKARVHGFTLIEVAVTAAIIALLATITFPMVELSVQRSKEKELRSALRQIRQAIDAYKKAGDEGHLVRKAGESGYPPTLKTLTEGVEDAKNPDRSASKLYFLRRIPRDPMNKNSSLKAEQTWGKRSYASSDDNPKEGEDVFDVYSLSKDVGLDGISYREW